MSTEVIIPSEELRKLGNPALRGLLALSLERFTRNRIEAILHSDKPDSELRHIDREETNQRKWETAERIFEGLVHRWISHPPLRPEFVSEYARELTITTKSMGAYEGDQETADRKYASWMGGKLNLSKEEIEKLEMETIEARFSHRLDSARKHVVDRLSVLPTETADRFFKSSQYFDEIHAIGENALSPRQLFSLFVDFEKVLVEYSQENVHPDAITEVRKAQYEIQRLFALADLYQDYEQTPEYQNLSLDFDFLTNKVASLFEAPASSDSPVGLPSARKIQPKNLLYAHTRSKRRYWRQKDGEYVFSNEPKPGFSEVRLESATFVGKRRNVLKRTTKIPVEHIEIRGMKDAASAVDKYLRKGLSSFGSILDQKGMIIVIDSFKGAKSKFLKALLENELGTGSSSWKQPLAWNEEEGKNPHTQASYRCLKGIMKVPHKLKPVKAAIASILEGVDRIASHGKKIGGRRKPQLLAEVRELNEDISRFVDRFRDSSYHVTLEVQIYDLESYVRAEKDPLSPANHDQYKRSQTLKDILPILFPIGVYGEEALRSILMPEILARLDYRS